MSASFRAVEAEKPEHERICFDPLAERFLGFPLSVVGKTPPWMKRAITRVLFWLIERYTPGNPGYVLTRTRYIDDYLQRCIADGLRQLVILGAGYDTRAYRFGALAGRVTVFEVDHPATQELKVRKVRRVFGALPAHVVYVPVDFDVERLDDKLPNSGYDEDLRTLFIWEGVIPYITAAGVEETLAFASDRSGEGSGIIFDYIFRSVVDGTERWAAARSWRVWLDRLREPLLFGIEAGAAEAFLGRWGFEEVHEVVVESLRNVYGIGARPIFPYAAIVDARTRSRDPA